MGRFDALTELDENQQSVQTPDTLPVEPTKKHSSPPLSQKEQGKEPGTQSSVAPSPVWDAPGLQTGKKHLADGKKPASPQNRKPATLSPALPDLEKPEKYTTRLEPSLVKKIRLEAIEKDIKDYEVVRTALNEYFAKHK
jgi:hypothetical protein